MDFTENESVKLSPIEEDNILEEYMMNVVCCETAQCGINAAVCYRLTNILYILSLLQVKKCHCLITLMSVR